MVDKSNIKFEMARLAAEADILQLGFELVVGTDEAGRGPLAGPVCAGAVAVTNVAAMDQDFYFLLDRVTDSKLLAPERRAEIYKIIISHPAIIWGFAAVSPVVIDRINILQASRLAMKRAIGNMWRRSGITASPDKIFCFVDGNKEIDIICRQQAVIGGDRKVFSISAASIVAKVGRDRLMVNFDRKYPGYGFARHKGYGTSRHLGALELLGPSPIHRKTFSPVSNIVKKFSTGSR